MKYSILKRKDQRVELAKLACCFDIFCKMDTDAKATAIMKWLIDNGFRVPNKEALKNWLDSENKCEPFYYNVYKITRNLCCGYWIFYLYGPGDNCIGEPKSCSQDIFESYLSCSSKCTDECCCPCCSFRNSNSSKL